MNELVHVYSGQLTGSQSEFANERARDGLGWSPQVSLEEGVRRATAFYREKLVKQGKIAG